MTAYFVSRHPGAAEWARRCGIPARRLEHLDPADVGPGDIVLGTLPVQMAAEVCARGGRYLHLCLDIPPDRRGEVLTAEEMDRFGARLEEYRVERAKRIGSDDANGER